MDMTNKIKGDERIRPNYLVGMQAKQNDLDQKVLDKEQDK